MKFLTHSILPLMLIPLISFANDCSDLSGKFHVQIADVRMQLDVLQTNCNELDFIYYYPGTQITRHYKIGEQPSLLIDDGDRIITETAEFEKLIIGDTREVIALKITRLEKSRLDEKTFKAISYFYPEKSPVGKALVERRDWYDESDSRFRRVYLGMVTRQ